MERTTLIQTGLAAPGVRGQKTLHLWALRVGAHLFAWIPLAWLAIDFQTGGLTANPIQDATQRMGRAAILLLMAALAVTPLRVLTGLRQVQPLARTLGLYAFGYALFHLYLYVGLDYGFDFNLLLLDVSGKPYIYVGLAAFVILLALAVTSFRWWMKRLGKRWKILHRLVYAAGLLAVIHYALAVKGDLLRLRGSVGQPIFYAILLAVLLALRLPPVRQAARVARERLSRFFQKHRNAV